MSALTAARRTLALTTASATAAASLAVVMAAPAHAATVTLATVQDVCNQPNQRVTLDQAITDAGAEVTIGCAATIDLAGHNLTVRNVVIQADHSLAVTDTSTDDPAQAGTLAADAGAVFGTAGIQTTGASLTTHKSAKVIARGGYYAAGVGSGWDDAGGSVTTYDSSQVTGYGGANAAGVGGGAQGAGGSVTTHDSSQVTGHGGANAAGVGGGGGAGAGAGGSVTTHESSQGRATAAPMPRVWAAATSVLVGRSRCMTRRR